VAAVFRVVRLWRIFQCLPVGNQCDGGGFLLVDWCDEPVATARNRLDESRIVGGIAKRLAQLVYGGVQAVVVVDEGVGGPPALAQIFAAYQFPGALEQVQQKLERLAGQARAVVSVLAQLAGAAVKLVDAEAEQTASVRQTAPSPWLAIILLRSSMIQPYKL